LLGHGPWFSPGTPAPSTTKAGRHDIAEILLKVALNQQNIRHLFQPPEIYINISKTTEWQSFNENFILNIFHPI
jgi:hypothetical protein